MSRVGRSIITSFGLPVTSGARLARLLLMFAGWGVVGAVLAFAFGLRRTDLLVVCAVIAMALFAAVSGIAYLLATRPKQAMRR